MASKYFEFIEHSVSTNRGNLLDVSAIGKDFITRRDYTCFTSMFLFDEDINVHMQELKDIGEKPSVSGYKGKCFMNYLWIDVDYKEATEDVRLNIESIIKGTKKLLNDIMLKYDMNEDMFKIYFSGYKGFHIGIPCAIFGAENFSSEAIPTIAKIMAKEITDRSNIVDFVVYNTTRIFRTPMSRHEKSGFYKVAISAQTILNLDIEKIMVMSKECQSENVNVDTVTINQTLKDLFAKCCGNSRHEFDLIETVKPEDNVITKNKTTFRIPDTNRNDALFKMGIRLMNIPKTHLTTDEVVDILRMIADVCNTHAMLKGKDQLTEHEVRTLINQAFKYTRLKQSTSIIEASNVTDFAMRVFNFALNSKYISTMVDTFDEDLGGGGILGNLYSVVGRGGTMKSVWLQNMAIHNATQGIWGTYFNQEMSENIFFDRTCRIVTETFFLEGVKSGEIKKEDIQKINHDIHDVIGKRLILVNQSNLNPNQIDDITKAKEDETGQKMAYGMIDSLSGMELIGGDEVRSNIHHSKNLKEVAKRRECCYYLIVHTNNSAPITARDLTEWVRGGSKVIDNGDAAFHLSKIIDTENSDYSRNRPDIIYLPGYVYIRFVNKRESGNTIDKVISIGNNLRVNVEERDAKDFNY